MICGMPANATYKLQAAKSREKYLKYKLMNIAYLKEACGEPDVSRIEAATQRLLQDHLLGRRRGR